MTQPGNRRLDTFFSDDDYRLYVTLLADQCQRAETEIWSYCPMPNHVHLIMVPSRAAGLGDESHGTIQSHARSGRPRGSEAFLDRLEGALGRTVRSQKRGPRPKKKE